MGKYPFLCCKVYKNCKKSKKLMQSIYKNKIEKELLFLIFFPKENSKYQLSFILAEVSCGKYM